MKQLLLLALSLELFLYQSWLQGEQRFMEEKHWNVVIMAGGSGTRLWPLSTEKTPKQVLPFKGGASLLQATIDRVSQTVPKEKIWIITAEQQTKLIAEHVADSVGNILSEPAARNTAAAILYTCLTIQQKDPQAVIAFLPSDHYIQEQDMFMHDIAQALSWANRQQKIVLLGIKPTFPATGYGYIEYDQPTDTQSAFYPIRKFHEKPSAQTALQYCNQSNMLWNAGIFCARADVFINEYKQHMPVMYTEVVASLENKELYKTVENISVDYAVMEKSNVTQVLPVSFTWSDVGNLNTFLSLLDKHQNKLDEVIAHKSSNNLLYTNKKHVALIGVHNLCIVETEDTLLIANREQVEEVKKILEELKS